MQDVKDFIETRIETLTQELHSMKMGIDARKNLGKKIAAELKGIKEIKASLHRQQKSTKLINRLHDETLENLQENEAILMNIKNYRVNSFLELTAMRKALESFK